MFPVSLSNATMWWTHAEARGCGDVGGVESVQGSSAAHEQQPGLLLQQQGAVVPGRADETGAAQQTCGDCGNLDLRQQNGSKCTSLSLKRGAATRGWFLERRLRRGEGRGGGGGALGGKNIGAFSVNHAPVMPNPISSSAAETLRL